MAPVIDMSTWDNQWRSSLAPDPEGPYVLIADGRPERAAACLESIKPFGVDARVARDGAEALDLLQQHGVPVLLIVDLSLPRPDGFAVIESLRASDQGRAQILAWSSLPELREFAAQRLAGPNVRVLSAAVSPDVLRGAIERALRRGLGAVEPPAPSDERGAEDAYEAMTALSEQAWKLSGATGVAVYWKAAGDTRFRASVTWAADTPIPYSPYHLPRVFGWILETGEPLVLPDLTAQHLSDVPISSEQDVVRGLVAVPIIGANEEIVGTICVFDLEPLAFDSEVVEALKALGRRGVQAPAPARMADAVDPPPPTWDTPEPEDVDEPPSSSTLEPAASDAPETARAPEPELAPSSGPKAARSPEPAPGISSAPARYVALLDRRDGTMLIAREQARMRREQRPITVVAFDVSPVAQDPQPSRSRALNGVFETVAETLADATRAADVAVRWGPGELLLLLPGLGATEARPVAERVRAVMQAAAGRRVAVSGGIVEMLPDDSLESAVERAQKQLQVARDRGHNRIA